VSQLKGTAYGKLHLFAGAGQLQLLLLHGLTGQKPVNTDKNESFLPVRKPLGLAAKEKFR
jgi:hypothetical protein